MVFDWCCESWWRMCSSQWTWGNSTPILTHISLIHFNLFKVYTRVSLYLDWLIENTNLNSQLPTEVPRQTCPGHTCVWGGNKCIASSEKCDGFVDCLGGEDEVQCTISLLDLLVGSNTTEDNSATNSTINPVVAPESVDFKSNKTVTKKDIKPEPFRCTKYVWYRNKIGFKLISFSEFLKLLPWISVVIKFSIAKTEPMKKIALVVITWSWLLRNLFVMDMSIALIKLMKLVAVSLNDFIFK